MKDRPDYIALARRLNQGGEALVLSRQARINELLMQALEADPSLEDLLGLHGEFIEPDHEGAEGC